MYLTNTYGHSSRPRDRTRDKCVPKFLWIPEHSIHMRVPRLRLAHSGAEIYKQTNLTLYNKFFNVHLTRLFLKKKKL